ncbi:MAG TPA: bifunctional serine/threonine-protein kinase/formylglycine-generating enzyme family protein, partial [Candidatus Hydrogenedentes bacterium]|nr:bifunctional serine/threonine-protein kinase/formylglycine-generating enzyme family protein [Candidatus Hydrogenedentota bacterium]
INGRYTVQDLIGRGGMGCIYKVHDNVLGEDVALKTLLPQFLREKMVVERFFNEARIARKLAHPNIVRVHDIGSAGKGVYISMEYVQGESLRNKLEKLPPGKRLPLDEVLRVVEELCTALEYAHQFTIHRDIKPENVMIDRDGRVKLMDFGISKLMDNTRMTSASIVMGTPYYMSPEQLRNSRDVDARSDIYSVGVMLYELVTGNMPTGVPKPASEMIREVPPELDRIIAKCVDPDPNNRYQTAGELRQAIAELRAKRAGKSGAPTRVASSAAATGKRSLRPDQLWLAVGVLMALVALSCAGVAVYWFRGIAGPVTPARQAGSSLGMDDLSIMGRAVDALMPRARNAASNNPELAQLLDKAVSLRKQVDDPAAGGPETRRSLAEQALALCMGVLELSRRPNMVFVPAGPVNIEGTTVNLPAFLIDRTEVTVEEYLAFTQNVPGQWRVPPHLAQNTGAISGRSPVTGITLFDAIAYAAANAKQLPTRAQWARAAYGLDDTPRNYPWGNDWIPEGCVCSGDSPAEVGTREKDRTVVGCLDMVGNAMEWTLPDDRAISERYPDFGDQAMVCGGSYQSGPRPLNSAVAVPVDARQPDLGFRCVVPITLPTADELRKIISGENAGEPQGAP